MKRVVILISGRGSNMEAIVAARLPIEIAAVISNRPDATGLDTARRAGIPAQALDHKAYAGREAFDAALMALIDAQAPDLVVLAGFMRILTPAFVAHYAGRLLNIHPSLLPAFPGLHTHQRALDAGVKIHGCSVHFVTADLDHGPIVVQAAVPVLAGDDAATLAARVLRQEHRIYPQAVRWFAEGRVAIADGKVTLSGAGGVSEQIDAVLVAARSTAAAAVTGDGSDGIDGGDGAQSARNARGLDAAVLCVPGIEA